ncbi:LytTR family DNA-binding domain-containing protein [Hydrogenophaga sp.]|uniref:LytR/AlgR family response regulator transcription factor n=1 Tax=Hydrogenophaga sp. TaxID=1904254 RepID=UPI00271F6486|nr:LytTR family DNA-binding domain-containing protein [Hydrogenophaga sp.]MDO9437318.1 LytTR family DNA-binding domain-containing protein [Hydrogenophaga sp.]
MNPRAPSVSQGLSVLVVDDEPLARRRLLRLLARLDWVGRVEEASDAVEARHKADALQPDILLLDIQMPGGSGFDVLERTSVEPPVVVFVTAFDHHALRAFDANAVDYVTKPIEPGRFGLAMERARQAVGARQQRDRLSEMQETIAALKQAMGAAPGPSSEIWAKVRNEYLRIAPESILRLQAERDYVRIHVSGADYLHHESLSSLERRLEPAVFLRIHRGTIVRREAVARIRQAPFGGLVAVLIDGTESRVGRTYVAGVRERFGPR